MHVPILHALVEQITKTNVKRKTGKNMSMQREWGRREQRVAKASNENACRRENWKIYIRNENVGKKVK